MVQFVDSHCHLQLMDLAEFNGNVGDVVKNARDNGLVHMLCVGTTLADTPTLISLAEQFPDVSASAGLHPNEIVEIEPRPEDILSLSQHPRVVAVGETGLDYYRKETDISLQQQRFRNHIHAAGLAKKPLIIHTRAARSDTLQILREENADKIGGVFHCFTEDWLTAEQALELNFYISFSGIVTFKNAVELQEVAKKVPLNRMLIETDAPYLAPTPHRGKINQPAYVRFVAEFLATLKGVSLSHLAAQTTENFNQLFGRW